MSPEQVGRCPVCKQNQFQPFLTCKDFTTSGEAFHLQKCGGCGMVITSPRPTEENAAAYYQSSDYISHKSSANNLIDAIYLIIRLFTTKWKYRLVLSFMEQKRLLDFGCGTGTFLDYCNQKGIEVYGVEPSAEARTLATKQNILAVEFVENLPDIKYNVITLWHVLEHVYDLEETLIKLKSRLAENGIIFIAVPNYQSFDAENYKEFWAGYDVPRHLWHFSKTNMTKILENCGLKCKEILPMKLDAYYVSLLSEKYKLNGKLSLTKAIRAIVMGYRSNVKARNNMNYSSLIYLAQK